MPPRLIVAVIIVGWLSAMGWLAAEKWLPGLSWLNEVGGPPPIAQEADGTAPDHGSWVLNREGKKSGSIATKMTPNKDGTFELTTKVQNAELAASPVAVTVPKFTTLRNVTRHGELVSFTAAGTLQFKGPGIDAKFEVQMSGSVHGDTYVSEWELDAGAGKVRRDSPAIPIGAKTVFGSLDPFQKYPNPRSELRPGRAWKVFAVDPMEEAVQVGLRHVIKKQLGMPLPVAEHKELLARVQDQTEDVEYRGNRYTCRVIVYRAKDVVAKTWVNEKDGKVMRHEASVLAEPTRVQRE